MIKLLIFDFDGTIADTKKAYYSSIYRNLEKRGLTKTEINKIIDEGLSLRITLDKLGLSFITRWLLHRKILQEVENYIKDIHKCQNVHYIKDISVKKILVSNSLKWFILKVLKHLQLNNYFLEIYGADNFSEKGKFIDSYIKKHNLNPKECIYIGDRVADVKLAKKIGCFGIIVSGKCAWNSKKELGKASPDFLIEDFSKLHRLINILDKKEVYYKNSMISSEIIR